MSVETFIANLKLPDEADRIYAAQDLGEANDAAAIAPLCDRLNVEASRAVKEAIMAALGRLQHPPVVNALETLLHSEDTFICNQAVQLLAERGPAALPCIEALLRTGDDHVRKLALDVLGRMPVAGVERLYRVGLQDANPNIVITAVEYIGATGVKALKPELEDLFTRAQEPMLLVAALEALCLVGDADSLDFILKRFPDLAAVPEMLLRSIIKAIGRLGHSRHAPRILRLLQHGNERLAQPVVDALISLRTRVPASPWPADLLETLWRLLDRELPDVVRYQLLVLLRHGPTGTEPSDRLVREVERLKDPELRQALREQMSAPTVP